MAQPLQRPDLTPSCQDVKIASLKQQIVSADSMIVCREASNYSYSQGYDVEIRHYRNVRNRAISDLAALGHKLPDDWLRSEEANNIRTGK